MDEVDREDRALDCPKCGDKAQLVEMRGYGDVYVCEDCGVIVIDLKLRIPKLLPPTR